jgi:hypothetical protein
MKALTIVLGGLFLVGLISVKAAVAVAFLGTCTAICLWINAKVKAPVSSHYRVEADDTVMLESYDGNFDHNPVNNRISECFVLWCHRPLIIC